MDLDELIVEEQQRPITQIFAEDGEEVFRNIERTALESTIEQHASMILSVGGGTPCFFNNIVTMKKHGTVIWLNTEVDILLERLIKGKQHRPLLRSIPDEEMKSYIIRKLNERKMYYEQAQVIIDHESSISESSFIQTILHA